MALKEIYEISEGINNKLSSFPLVINFPPRNSAGARNRGGNSTIPNLIILLWSSIIRGRRESFQNTHTKRYSTEGVTLYAQKDIHTHNSLSPI